jgi:superfamily II DNA or RNA helicase
MHHVIASSIRNIMQKLKNLKYSIGVTGTFPKEKLYDYLVLQAYIGPVVYKFTANQLINEEKRGTPIFIIFEYMNWATNEEKETLYILRSNKNNDDIQAGNKILKQERLFVNNSYTRLKFICDKAIQTKKNTLILFGDIKYGYGNKLYEYIKNNSNKDVYYVDGNTKNENREYYKECMEKDLEGNTIIVASIKTFGEGIDMKNLWSIFLVDTSKSDRIVRQICGRGLRLFPGKDKVILFDFVDDLRYSTHPKKYYKDNYLWKHALERKKIYQEQNFPIYEEKIKFK